MVVVNLSFPEMKWKKVIALLKKILCSCVVKFGRDEVVELENGRDTCNDRYDRKHKVCVENYFSRPDRIYACNVAIDKMDKDLVGEIHFYFILDKKRRETFLL